MTEYEHTGNPHIDRIGIMCNHICGCKRKLLASSSIENKKCVDCRLGNCRSRKLLTKSDIYD